MRCSQPAAALALTLWLLAAGCGPASSPSRTTAVAVAADTIYTGGDIVTVDRAQPTAEALAVKDVKVVETIKEGKTVYRR